MNILKPTLKYFFDKGPQLVLLTIVPSLLSALLFSPSASLYYLTEYRDAYASDFAEMYRQIHSLPYDFFYLGIIGFVLYVFVLALLFGIVDRHMRIGEFTLSFRRAKTRINYNILTAVKFTVLFLVVLFVGDVLLAALYYLWVVALGSGAGWLVLSLFSRLLVAAFLIFFASSMLLWPPFMLHTGLRSRDAFRMGWRQMSGKVLKCMLTLLVVVVPFQIAMVIVGTVSDSTVARVILDGLAYAVILPYYVIMMYNVFYDVTGTERMDLQKIDIWSKKTRKIKGNRNDV